MRKKLSPDQLLNINAAKIGDTVSFGTQCRQSVQTDQKMFLFVVNCNFY